MEGAVGVRRHIGLVRHEHDRVAGFMEASEQSHNLGAGLRIEVPGRLVGKKNRRIVHERARDRHALALATRKLVGPVRHAARQFNLL